MTLLEAWGNLANVLDGLDDMSDEECEAYDELWAAIRPRVTDSDKNGAHVFTFEPWSDGHALGFKVTRHEDGAVSYVYLNPSTDTWSNGKFNPDVFVYTGTHGDPANDFPNHYYNIEFTEEKEQHR